MQKTLKKYFPVFLLPTVIAFCIAFIIPFVTGLYLSFCDFTTVSNAKFVGFANYIKASIWIYNTIHNNINYNSKYYSIYFSISFN